MSSASAVAKELMRLSLAGPLPEPLSYYRLQCLLYYAQAWSLVLRDSELFPDEIKAADQGPGIPAILEVQDKNPVWHNIQLDIFDQEPNLDEADEALFLDHLWLAYRDLSALGLFASIQQEPCFLKAMKEREMWGRGVIGTDGLRESFTRRPGFPAALHEYRSLRQEREKEAELAILTSPPLDRATIWKDCRSVTPSAEQR